MKNSLVDHTVTTFVASKARKQLSTRRVLFHIEDRLKEYDFDNKLAIQRVMPPVSVALCPTSFCVRECIFCSNTSRNIENRKVCAEYDNGVFLCVLKDLNALDVKGVSIAGGGEPLVYKRPALDSLLLTPNQSFKIGIHTNGVLLDKILSPAFMESGNIKYVNVSVVGHSATLYEKVTGGNKQQFEKVEHNIRRAVKMDGESESFPVFGVKILINRENYQFIKEIKDYFECLGVENVLLRCVGNFEPGQDVELTGAQYEKLESLLSTELAMLEDQIRAVTGKSDLVPPIPSRCWIMALQFTGGIDPDGEVYLCSPWSQKEYSIGNVNKERLSEIWGSDRHKAVAHTLNEKMRCGECNPLLCRHYYSNLAIDGYIAREVPSLNQDKFDDMYGRFI